MFAFGNGLLLQVPDLVPIVLVEFDYLVTKDKIEEDENFKDFLNPVVSKHLKVHLEDVKLVGGELVPGRRASSRGSRYEGSIDLGKLFRRRWMLECGNVVKFTPRGSHYHNARADKHAIIHTQSNPYHGWCVFLFSSG